MKLLILSPEKTLLDTEELPGTLGRFTVLRGHDRLITYLTEGIVRYQPMQATTDDERMEVPVKGGFAEINGAHFLV